MNTRFLAFALPFLLLSSSSVVHAVEDDAPHSGLRGLKGHSAGKKFKNVIMLIPDGCDDATLALARWYKKENLQVDELSRGSHHPYMSNSVIVDSAPGGTAFSTGQLTTDKFIAVGPQRDDLLSHLNSWDLWPAYAPIPTVLEGAKGLGMSTGLVSTSRVTHATPASFASHVDNRSKENEIALHMAMNGVDVVMGGGGDRLLPHRSCPNAVPGRSGSRNDCYNLETELESRGYELCFNAHDMHSIHVEPGKKVWCALASGAMEPDIDRQHFAQDQPSLAEMTEKAIDLLSQNDHGFFLMVEGSQVDWAGHANDVSIQFCSI
jgi:alkaline phosphatase